DGQHHTVGEAPADGGDGDTPEGLPAGGAQGRGRLLLIVTDLVQDRFHLPYHERHGHEDGRQHHPGQREDHPETPFGDHPEPAAHTPQHDQRDTHHHRRDRERQVHQTLQQPPAREVPAYQGQRDHHPEDHVHAHHDDQDDHGQVAGGDSGRRAALVD